MVSRLSFSGCRSQWSMMEAWACLQLSGWFSFWRGILVLRLHQCWNPILWPIGPVLINVLSCHYPTSKFLPTLNFLFTFVSATSDFQSSCLLSGSHRIFSGSPIPSFSSRRHLASKYRVILGSRLTSWTNFMVCFSPPWSLLFSACWWCWLSVGVWLGFWSSPALKAV